MLNVNGVKTLLFVWMSAVVALTGPGCDSPDPAAEDPFQQLASGPRPSGGSEAGAPAAGAPAAGAPAAGAPAAGAPAVGDAPAPQGAPEAGGQPPEGAPPPEGAASEGGPPPESVHVPGDGHPQGVGEGSSAKLDPSSFVKVSGTISVEGWDQPLQLDFTEINNQGPEGRPRLTILRIPKPGAFEVGIPKDAGTVEINVYLDAKGDGPGDGDIMLSNPSGPIEVGEEDIGDVKLVLDRSGPAPEPREGSRGAAPPSGPRTAEGEGPAGLDNAGSQAAEPPPPPEEAQEGAAPSEGGHQ